MKLRYGKKSYPVASIEEAQAIWDKIRDEAMAQGLGNSDMAHDPILTDDKGKAIGWISWNGKAWKGTPKDREQIPLSA